MSDHLDGEFRSRAERLAKDPTAMAKLLASASAKADTQASKISRVRADFVRLVRMLGAYAKGEYRRIPWTSVVTAVAAVLYFLNPMDLIPDFIIGTGYLDDASVIAFCLNSLRKDLAAFALWESSGKPEINASSDPKS